MHKEPWSTKSDSGSNNPAQPTYHQEEVCPSSWTEASQGPIPKASQEEGHEN